MIHYPRMDDGLFHLTPDGWVRCDHEPFPFDRLETWSYRMEHPDRQAKQSVSLRRQWVCEKMSQEGRTAFHALFGEALQPSTGRSVTLDHDI